MVDLGIFPTETAALPICVSQLETSWFADGLLGKERPMLREGSNTGRVMMAYLRVHVWRARNFSRLREEQQEGVPSPDKGLFLPSTGSYLAPQGAILPQVNIYMIAPAAVLKEPEAGFSPLQSTCFTIVVYCTQI